ncbi:MAG TPA: DUF5678 domain-containing protein [Gaiellaceae bacterium]|jgi:hypothetical protein|nr:DUF5678 domain-containing protein [Gaiellaceae bacterium]
MTDELDAYDGQWVAMRDGHVVAHAEDEESIRAHADVQPADLVFPIGVPPSGFYLINV